jgi:AcrR family transcriptional regulator
MDSKNDGTSQCSDEPDKQGCARDRILQSAGTIFAEKGFRGSTVREICDAAEVNIASVNYYFGDKKSLYEETLLLAREIGARTYPTPDFSSFESPEHRLRGMILLLLHRLVANHSEPWPVKILMAEILAPSVAARPLIDGYIEPFLDAMFTTVAQLLPPEATESLVRQTGFSIVAQCVYYRFADTLNRMVVADGSFEKDFSVNVLAHQIYEFSLAGIQGIEQRLRREKEGQLDSAVV